MTKSLPTRAWFYRGDVLRLSRLPEEALADYSRAIELDPADPNIRRARGAALLDLGRWNEAAGDVALGLTGVRSPQLWAIHACLQLHMGDLAEYRRACACLLDQFGDYPMPRGLAAIVRSCVLAPDSVSDPARVVELARRAESLTPGECDATMLLGAALLRAGRPKEALPQLERAVEMRQKDRLSPNDAHLYLAITLHQLGRNAEAQRWRDAALDRTRARGAAPPDLARDVREPILLQEINALLELPFGAEGQSGIHEIAVRLR